jgi:hypothetical protein
MDPKPEDYIGWTVTLQIPVQKRLVRRTSVPALSAYLARGLGESFKNMPPDFIVQSAEKLKKEFKNRFTPPILGVDGKPYRM